MSGYTVTSATVPGDVLYIAGQPRYNHTGQVVVYRMEGGDIQILQTLRGEQVGGAVIVVNESILTLCSFNLSACCPN